MLGILLSFAIGMFTWTLMEWFIHNILGHKPKGRHRISREHLDHHTDPDYFTSAAKKLALAIPVISAMFGLGTLIIATELAGAFALGVGAGWLAYEVLHRKLHTSPPWNAYGRWARRHHFHHHFGSPRMNHGVTTPLWDILFGTYEKPTTVRVPKKQAHKLRWLLERSDDGAVRVDPRFEADYKVV
jgi:sterol desaturase/sphingolipid hydroxylase (fatty acid hydroxylase superfamily)